MEKLDIQTDLTNIDLDYGIREAFSTKSNTRFVFEPVRVKSFQVKKFDKKEYAKHILNLVSVNPIYTENVVARLRKDGLNENQIVSVLDFGIEHSYFLFNSNRTMIKSASLNVAEKLPYRDRKNLPESAFAWPEKRKYPVHDPSHARNAMARLSAAFNSGRISKRDYNRIRKNILIAYIKFGIRPRKVSSPRYALPAGIKMAAE